MARGGGGGVRVDAGGGWMRVGGAGGGSVREECRDDARAPQVAPLAQVQVAKLRLEVPPAEGGKRERERRVSMAGSSRVSMASEHGGGSEEATHA